MPTINFDNQDNFYDIVDSDVYQLAFLDGEDELLIRADDVKVRAHMGNDNDSLLIESDDSEIEVDLGNGDDYAVISGQGLTLVEGGYGRDIFDIFNATNIWADGGEGNDIFYVEAGAGSSITVRGGNGNDTYYISGSGSPEIVEYVNGGTDTVFLGTVTNYFMDATIENLSTSFDPSNLASFSITADGVTNNVINATGQNAATIWAGDGNDTVQTGSGNDLVLGEAGNDSLSSGAGADMLFGGMGRDILAGGDGADIFRFDSAAESAWNMLGYYDSISDYEANSDIIDLHNIDANWSVAGNQSFILLGAPTGAAGQLWITSLGNDNYRIFGDVNGGGADFALTVHMTGGDASDFMFAF